MQTLLNCKDPIETLVKSLLNYKGRRESEARTQGRAGRSPSCSTCGRGRRNRVNRHRCKCKSRAGSPCPSLYARALMFPPKLTPAGCGGPVPCRWAHPPAPAIKEFSGIFSRISIGSLKSNGISQQSPSNPIGISIGSFKFNGDFNKVLKTQ